MELNENSKLDIVNPDEEQLTETAGDIIIESPEDVEVFEGEVEVIGIDKRDINFKSLLNDLLQIVNLSEEVISKLNPDSKYVLQIPAKFREGLKNGKYWLMENQDADKTYAFIMGFNKDGKKTIVSPLTVKAEDVIPKQSVNSFSSAYQNLLIQNQMRELMQRLEDIGAVVKQIEQGQMDDRIAQFVTGKQQILLALAQEDEAKRNEALKTGINNLQLAQNQALASLKTKAEAFTPIPKSPVKHFIEEVKKNGYHRSKDDEFSRVYTYYDMFIESTRLIACSYYTLGDMKSAEMTIDMASQSLSEIDFEKVSTIDYLHSDYYEGTNLNLNPAEPIQDKELLLSGDGENTTLEIEIDGTELLEAISDEEN